MIYGSILRWSPTGPGTINPNQQLLLASASFDATVKLWDVEGGKRLFAALMVTRVLYILFHLAQTASFWPLDRWTKTLHVWSLKDGKIVKTYTGTGGIFEVCWNKIAACFANNNVCVLDYRM